MFQSLKEISDALNFVTLEVYVDLGNINVCSYTSDNVPSGEISGYNPTELCNKAKKVFPDIYWSNVQVESQIRTEMSFKVDYNLGTDSLYICGYSTVSFPLNDSIVRVLQKAGHKIVLFPMPSHGDEVESHVLKKSLSGTSVLDIIKLDSSLRDINSPSLPPRPYSSRAQRNLSNRIIQQPTRTHASYMFLPSHLIEDEFHFPVVEKLPSLHHCRNDFALDDFRELQHLVDGTNCSVFTAILGTERVVIKMLSESSENDPISVLEFDSEYVMLCRLSHPNIIRVIGAGIHPRKFIVLEHLSGGTVASIQEASKESRSVLQRRVFGSSAFEFSDVLRMGLELASAMDYLHSQVHSDATIIHRDIKPQNVGFTEDGTLKIFDFGLCSAVRRTTESDEKYEMTGCTGSLRFMAPEVVLSMPYTEKVDVYSFAVLLWHLATGEEPFGRIDSSNFTMNVVLHGERPRIDKSWPAAFSSLLQSCWHANMKQRPSFTSIVSVLTSLLQTKRPSMWSAGRRKPSSEHIGGGHGGHGGHASIDSDRRSMASPACVSGEAAAAGSGRWKYPLWSSGSRGQLIGGGGVSANGNGRSEMEPSAPSRASARSSWSRGNTVVTSREQEQDMSGKSSSSLLSRGSTGKVSPLSESMATPAVFVDRRPRSSLSRLSSATSINVRKVTPDEPVDGARKSSWF